MRAKKKPSNGSAEKTVRAHPAGDTATLCCGGEDPDRTAGASR